MKENYNQNDFMVIKEKAMFFKEFRINVGLSQKEIAQKLNLQAPAIARYEANSISPSSSAIQKYCETLDANPTFLFFGQEPYLLSAVPQVSVENGYLLNDLNSLFSQEELAKKLREILIEAILAKVRWIEKDSVLTKLFETILLAEQTKKRPFYFLYYVLQKISVTKNQPKVVIANAKDFILCLFAEDELIEISQIIESNFAEGDCITLLEQTDTFLLLLERNMGIETIKKYKGLK